jgi:hypothetical protein
MSREELAELLEMLPEMTEAMPPYTGDERERELLLAYLADLAASRGGTATAGAAEGRSGS